MADNSGALSFFWPEIDDADSAKSASRTGVLGASLFAIYAAGLATYALAKGHVALVPAGVTLYLEAALFAGLAFGIWRMSRVAAALALFVFLAEQALAALRTGSMVGLIMPIAIALFLCSGLRGTLAYRKYTKPPGEVESGDA